MLCASPHGQRWRWLASHPDADTGELLLVERDGACPGDPDGDIVAITTGVHPEDVPAAVRSWLAGRSRMVGRDALVDADRPPSPTRDPVAWDPVDRSLDHGRARAAVAAPAEGRAAGFCVFGNPAADQS